jgi:hypothetical protein
LRNELTEKEYVYLKLAKLNEFVDDLYHCTQYPNNTIIDAKASYKYINQIREDLMRINKNTIK